jgi:hypothetical protein
LFFRQSHGVILINGPGESSANRSSISRNYCAGQSACAKIARGGFSICQQIAVYAGGTVLALGNTAIGGAFAFPWNQSLTNNIGNSMKLNRIITLCAVAATLAISATSLLAQDNGGQRGPRGNFDPAQFQQRILERYQEQLGFTNEVEWDAVKPLVQKVMDARSATMSGMGRGMFGGRNRGGDQGGPGGMFQSGPEQQALEKALKDNAPASQIKDLLAKYKAAQKVKQAKLEAAQDELKKVLTTKQEAEACLLGLVR